MNPYMMYIQQRRRVELAPGIFVLVPFGPIMPFQAMAIDEYQARLLTLKQAKASGLSLPAHVN